MATVSELGSRVTDSSSGRPIIAALASPGKALGATTINIDAATNWTTTTPIHFSIYETVVVAGISVKDPDTQTDWKGVLAGTAVGSLTLTGGTDREYTAGAIVELTPTARYAKDLFDWVNSFANTDGTLKAAPIQTALGLGSDSLNGWNVLGTTISSVTYNGNRSYDLATAADQTGTLSPGMRLRTTRGTAAPTQSTSLNGTSQYWSKTAPAGMTFTDDFTVSAWVKLSSYNVCCVASRYGGASGWLLQIQTDGTVRLAGTNGSGSNYSDIRSYQSLPLNKWVHITAQLDMSAYTATSTTSYIMVDGVDVPAFVARAGTNPTALVQSGNLEVGSLNGAQFFPGKIAQVAIFSAKVTQATMRGYISQGLTGSETSLISAYSFNGVATDLNTTNANNLTASGAATATEADSPFGGQASGSISSTLDYGIVQKVTASTVTVQVAEGCTVDTSGAISAVSYSTMRSPYGFPGQRGKWEIVIHRNTDELANATASVYSLGSAGIYINVPTGSWTIGYSGTLYCNGSSVGATTGVTVGTSTSGGAFGSEQDITMTSLISQQVNGVGNRTAAAKEKEISLDSATIYYLLKYTASLTAQGLLSGHKLYARNAYL